MPKDPNILLSYVNMKLRDFYKDLDAFCAAECVDRNELEERLGDVNYDYDPDTNQFTTSWGDYAFPNERPKYPWE